MLKAYHQFINTLQLSEERKLNLTDGSLLKKSHKFYVNLFKYLHPLYPRVTEIDKLTSLAYLHFRFLLIFDNFIDKKNEGQQLEDLAIGFTLYEQSIRGLAELINDEPFWHCLSELKKQYFSTLQYEKELSKEQLHITEPLFKKLAIGKSALCFASVQAMESIGGKSIHKHKVIQCLEQIHIAFQIIDDIDDFKKDIEELQWTYVRNQLQIYLEENNITPQSTELLVRYLYTSGIAEDHLLKALFHYNEAFKIADSLSLHDLKSFLKEEIKKIETYVKEIGFVKQKTIQKLQKSNRFKSSNSIVAAIQDGLNYLKSQQSADGSWNDFYTSAGQGSTWTTAYVGFQISQINAGLGFLPEALNNIRLSKGSFNQNILSDGDSLNFVIGFNNSMKRGIPKELEDRWFKFHQKDTGWATYINEQLLREQLELDPKISLQGWMSSKTCVSAASAYILSLLGEQYSRYYLSTCQFLISNIKENGCMESYWWTSPVYATSFAVLALTQSEQYKKYAHQSIMWLLSNQNREGFWANNFTGEKSPLYTALALKALTSSDTYNNNRLSIDKAVDWLLENQTSDGSWLTNRVLRIPATDIEDPGSIKSWRKSSFGVNCVVDDHNRLFSTSTVVNALWHYKTQFL